MLTAVARRMLSTGRSLSTIAVVLSGCGVYDGSEVHEASAVLVSLSRESADYKVYAPDKPQMHTVNHMTGEEIKGDNRNVLIESARIARGKIEKLSELDVSKHDAVIFPGGFGAAKNWCDFAVKQADCTVDEEVSTVLKNFHAAKKPIGLCCIAPVLAAKVIPGCEVTMGQESEDGGRWPFAGACGAVKAMGSTHVPKNVDEIHIDQANKVVTTPAFMCDTKFHEIHDGVAKMVKGVLGLVEK
ncbi:ES1 protein homolog, mitochondrial-like [Rhopilema esculentum]|uniref:ES1 protein homolog, mitochondrial-like n=1 Tax=Rhopilema esculentum TaxID=499914 RepID=UPI0031E29413|eukprot:gene12103-2704_t